MIKLLFSIIIFFVLIALLFGVAGISFLRALFGFGNKTPKQPKNDTQHTYSGSEKQDKIFGEHEGEYVEFEEIKEGDVSDE